LNVYRELMGLEDPRKLTRSAKTLRTGSGPYQEAEELLKAVELRVIAGKLGIIRFEEISGHVIITFADDRRMDLLLKKDNNKITQVRNS